MRRNQEPLRAKYPHLSTYSIFNSNPILFSDPDGNDFKLTGSKSNVSSIIKILNDGIGQEVLSINSKNNLVDIQKLNNKEIKSLSKQEKTLYSLLVKMTDKNINQISINVENQSQDIIFGNYNKSAIDLYDIENAGTGKAINKYSIIGHELNEQFEKQINNYSFDKAHKKGKDIEESITGFKRMGQLESSKLTKDNNLINGNMDILYQKNDIKVKASIIIENNNVKNIKTTIQSKGSTNAKK